MHLNGTWRRWSQWVPALPDVTGYAAVIPTLSNVRTEEDSTDGSRQHVSRHAYRYS